MLSVVNTSLGIITIVGHIAVVGVGLYLFLSSREEKNRLLNFLAKHALLFAFVVSSGATMASLFYSGVAGFEPCSLCWYQRIFMFPLAIMLGIAFFKKDVRVMRYAVPLATIGLIIAAYQLYLYYGGALVVPCSATQVGLCAKRYVSEFGYITIPSMSATSFLLVLLALWPLKWRDNA